MQWGACRVTCLRIMPVDPFLMRIRVICFSLSTALCSYANDAIKQMENKMVLLQALTNSGLVLSGYPTPNH